MLNEEQIARIAHEANRAYCEALGDHTQVPWENAPNWQKESAMDGVGFHLANPDAGVEWSHENWMQQKLGDGWRYGPVKDPDNKLHPCIKPFQHLPPEQQAKNYIFRGVVHALAVHAEFATEENENVDK